MKRIVTQLEAVDSWLEQVPVDISSLTKGELMEISVDLMNHTLFLLKLTCSLAPPGIDTSHGYSRNRAIVAGHMIRLTKLYEGLLMHVAANQGELAAIFNRLIFETDTRMAYLMKARNSSFRSFILSSYKPERENLADLAAKASTRKLIPIELRIRRKIRARLRRDGISLAELKANRHWHLDGKNFRGLMKDAGIDAWYSYVFGSASHSVHGDWYDISCLQLIKKGRHFLPKIEFDRTDPRYSGPMTQIALASAARFLTWNKTDPLKSLRRLIEKAIEVNRRIDEEDERRIGP